MPDLKIYVLGFFSENLHFSETCVFWNLHFLKTWLSPCILVKPFCEPAFFWIFHENLHFCENLTFMKTTFFWKPDFQPTEVFLWNLHFSGFFMKTCILVEPEPAFLRKPDFHVNLHFSGNEPPFFWKPGFITFSRKPDFQTKIPQFQPRPSPKFAKKPFKVD